MSFEDKLKESGYVSAWNEGALQIRRLDIEQAESNFLNTDLLAIHPIFNKPNYLVIFEKIRNLFKEASSKLTKNEKELGLRYIKVIEDAFECFPIYEEKTYNNLSGVRKKRKLNKENFKKIKELLFRFELLIRKFLEEHNLTAPKGESPEFSAFG